MTNIRLIASVSDDANLWSPEQMLRDAADECASGKRKHNKALLLFLDDHNEPYGVGFANAGMKMSECVALCEVMKQRFIGLLHET